MLSNTVVAKNIDNYNSVSTDIKSQNYATINVHVNCKDSGVENNYKFEFKTAEDFKNFNIEELNILLKDYEDVCEVTATFSVSVTFEASVGVVGGSITYSASMTITASCDEIVAAGERAVANLEAMLRNRRQRAIELIRSE